MPPLLIQSEKSRLLYLCGIQPLQIYVVLFGGYKAALYLTSHFIMLRKNSLAFRKSGRDICRFFVGQLSPEFGA